MKKDFQTSSLIVGIFLPNEEATITLKRKYRTRLNTRERNSNEIAAFKKIIFPRDLLRKNSFAKTKSRMPSDVPYKTPIIIAITIFGHKRITIGCDKECINASLAKWMITISKTKATIQKLTCTIILFSNGNLVTNRRTL